MDPPQSLRVPPGEPPPFEILEEAGAGGMGIVYRARDRASGRLLAVKVMKDEAGDAVRFAREADVLAMLRHPHIVSYEHHGTTPEGHFYLAMEWLEGESLEDRLGRDLLSSAETVRVAHAIADALVVAHEVGVIHRDLKPSNVFVTTDGTYKLLDFGVAKLPGEPGQTITRTGAALGTPGYMSPEQARGAKIDARSDLFSLGCVIFYCLGRSRPFAGSDLLAFATALALDDPPLLREVAPDVSAGLEALVQRLLAKKPEARPQTAAAVRDALAQLMEDAVPTSELLEPPARTGPARAPTPDAAAGSTLANTDAPPRAQTTLANDSPDALPRPIASTPSATAAPAAKESARSTRRSPLLVPALAAAVGVPLLLVAWSSIRGDQTAPDIAPGAIAAPSPSSSESALPLATTSSLAETDRAALEQTCREWAKHLVTSQRTDGSFSSDPHAAPSGWDTAQHLLALALSKRACGGVHAGALTAGARALGQLRVAGGWRGAQQGASLAGRAPRAETPATAWALLALSELERDGEVPSLGPSIAQARADLLRARAPDGGFRYLAGDTQPPMLYSTLLAAWALLDADDAVDAGALAPETAAAFAWLERDVASGAESTRIPGVTEQLAWVLAHRERRVPATTARAAMGAVASQMLVHCDLRDGRCDRSSADAAKIERGPDAGTLVTLWHPWATAGAFELSRVSGELVDTETGARLAAISRWGHGVLRSNSRALAAMPEYKLAEYLITIALTLGSP